MLGLVYYKPSFYIERYENPFNKYYMHCIISVKGMSESCINTLEPIIVALQSYSATIGDNYFSTFAIAMQSYKIGFYFYFSLS